MICIKVEIPKELSSIDDELKAIYHSEDSICIWVFKSRESRNTFMDNTINMSRAEGKNILIIIIQINYFPSNQLEDCIFSPNPSINEHLIFRNRLLRNSIIILISSICKSQFVFISIFIYNFFNCSTYSSVFIN